MLKKLKDSEKYCSERFSNQLNNSGSYDRGIPHELPMILVEDGITGALWMDDLEVLCFSMKNQEPQASFNFFIVSVQIQNMISEKSDVRHSYINSNLMMNILQDTTKPYAKGAKVNQLVK